MIQDKRHQAKCLESAKQNQRRLTFPYLSYFVLFQSSCFSGTGTLRDPLSNFKLLKTCVCTQHLQCHNDIMQLGTLVADLACASWNHFEVATWAEDLLRNWCNCVAAVLPKPNRFLRSWLGILKFNVSPKYFRDHLWHHFLSFPKECRA